MRQTTLCLLVNGGKILLAMKKRSFGVGKWNGVGGKLDEGMGDKNVFDAIKRETKEEIGVELLNFEKVGVLHFKFSYKSEWDQDVHLFLANSWQGEPVETEEMMPKWFNISEIPYSQMWDDDKHWLPLVLEGKKINANFIFKEGEIIEKFSIESVRNFD